MLSHLLTARQTGFLLRRSMFATSISAAVTPVFTSVTMTMTSAVSMAISAWRRMNFSISLSVFGSMPPVSTISNSRPFQSQSP